jgi:hypothetical protein
MNREILLAQFEAIRNMPGYKMARQGAHSLSAEELKQTEGVYAAVDEILLVCASEIPEDYTATEEDRAAIGKVLDTGVTGERKRPSEFIGEGPSAAQAVATIRAALIEFEIPVHGKHCANWKLFVERAKPVMLNDGQYI